MLAHSRDPLPDLLPLVRAEKRQSASATRVGEQKENGVVVVYTDQPPASSEMLNPSRLLASHTELDTTIERGDPALLQNLEAPYHKREKASSFPIPSHPVSDHAMPTPCNIHSSRPRERLPLSRMVRLSSLCAAKLFEAPLRRGFPLSRLSA